MMRCSWFLSFLSCVVVVVAKRKIGCDEAVCLEQVLSPPEGTDEDSGFGEGSALSGKFLLAGARNDDQVHAYKKIRGTWEEQETIGQDGGFGWSVDVSGDVFVTAAIRDDEAGPEPAGAVYVYETSDRGKSWDEVEKLLPWHHDDPFEFGENEVVIDGDVLVVGSTEALVKDDVRRGAADVYRRKGATWELKQNLDSDAAEANIGASVAIAMPFVAVGSNGANGDVTKMKVILWYTDDDGESWEETQVIANSPDGVTWNKFGIMAGSTDLHKFLVIGAEDEADNEDENPGAAYVFKRDDDDDDDDTTFKFFQKLQADDGGDDLPDVDDFGKHVATYGDYVLVGSAKGTYVFKYDDERLSFLQRLPLSEDAGDEDTVDDIVMDKDTIAIGDGSRHISIFRICDDKDDEDEDEGEDEGD